LVNDCDFPRHSDFKRVFEDLSRRRSRNPAAFGLTVKDTMLINHDLIAKGTRVRAFVTTSLILVARRTAGGG
jgi:hypothetical protein